jgi:ssDNA-binding Zn-finger/Zn-ribbon topoisomerase 1
MSEPTRITEPVDPAGPVGPFDAVASPEAMSTVETPDTTETVTCPECGRATAIAVRRRDAASFCPACDFPLFWGPTRVTLDGDGRAADDSLRRLPGTAGRTTVAAVTCPHCAEQNPVSASVCVRCGRSLHPEAVQRATEPEPVLVPAMVSQPEPEPEAESAVWLWVAAAVALLILAVVVFGLTTN